MSAADPNRPDGLSRRALLGRVGAAGAFVALTDVLPPAVGDAEAQASRPAARDPLETLTQAEAQTLLAAYGVELWPTISVQTADEAVAAAQQIGRASCRERV